MSCPGPIRRRDFLRVGTLALGGIGLNHLLAAGLNGADKPADTSVILFWMWGGPSQFETYDMKPEAPVEYRGPFRPMKTVFVGSEARTLMKIVVDGVTDKVLGCHIVGPDAGEMIQMLSIAIKMGATKADLDATMAVHPTAAEELVTMRTVTETHIRQAAE